MTRDRDYKPPFHRHMPLSEAREHLRPLAQSTDGAECPVCTQHVKVYERSLTSVAARAVIALYKECGRSFGQMKVAAEIHLADVANQGGYLVLAQHWGLIEEERVQRPDAGRAGWWRVTELGERWVGGEATVPAHVRIFDARRLGEPYGDPVSARDALGKHFHFLELVAKPAPAVGGGEEDDLFSTRAEAA